MAQNTSSRANNNQYVRTSVVLQAFTTSKDGKSRTPFASLPLEEYNSKGRPMDVTFAEYIDPLVGKTPAELKALYPKIVIASNVKETQVLGDKDFINLQFTSGSGTRTNTFYQLLPQGWLMYRTGMVPVNPVAEAAKKAREEALLQEMP